MGNYGDPGTIRHDASHTVTWNGVTSIQDTTTGTTVDPSAYTATGAAGMNWAQAVPEPASAALLVCGMFGFGLRRRR